MISTKKVDHLKMAEITMFKSRLHVIEEMHNNIMSESLVNLIERTPVPSKTCLVFLIMCKWRLSRLWHENTKYL